MNGRQKSYGYGTVVNSNDHVLYDLAEAYGDDDRLLVGMQDQV